MGNKATNLAVLVSLVTGLAISPSVGADEAKPNPLTKTQLIQGPSLRETGRVGSMFVQGGEVRAPRNDLEVPKENSIQHASTMEDRPLPQPRAGIVDRAVLDRQIRARFASVRDCRVEVARRKQVAPARVNAGALTLRWVILPTGEVVAAAVVVTTPTDGELVDCVKRRMVTWTFTRPRGGSVAVERTLNFR